MCGRYTLVSAPAVLEKVFGIGGWPTGFARYNIAPSQVVPVIRLGARGPELAWLVWGLVPHWAKEAKTGYSMINARAETVEKKPAFRSAFRHQRCLVPADGFYEWKLTAGFKQPYYIGLKTGEPFAMAGLWEHWEGPDKAVIESFTIVVTQANDLLSPVHDRMPVIVPPAGHAMWLDAKADVQSVRSLLAPFPSEAMRRYPVSPRVNNPKADAPGLIGEILVQGTRTAGQDPL
ncbi:MAG: SOS response-associated peptidase [Betaproteobacteria bacterium]|nr:SOS response-associated peptidase [Betaproteobacteria bacterium]